MFGSKKKIVVGATTLNLCENPPDLTKDAVLKAIARKDLSVAESLLDNALNGFGAKMNSVYSYAENYYALGVPQGFHSGLVQPDEEDVKDIIESLIGSEIIIRYCFFDSLTLEYIVMDYLSQHKEYNSQDNSVPSHYFHNDGGSTYVHDIEYIYYQQVKITYKHTAPTIYYTEETFNIPAGMYVGERYYITGYSKVINGEVENKTLNWLHRANSTEYPSLTYDIFKPFNTKGFLPIVPVRKNNQDLTAGSYQNTNLYRTSKALLSRLQLDIDQLAEKINENPDVGEIDHAWVMFGVPIQTKNKACLKYLIEFFHYLGSISQYTYTSHKQNAAAGLLPNENTVRVDLSFAEYGLDIDLNYVSIHTSYYVGNIGTVGTVTSQLKSGGRVRYISNFTSTRYTEFGSQVILREQLSTNHYREVVVTGLEHVNNVYLTYKVTTTIAEVISADDNTGNFIIPVYYEISDQLPLSVQNELYGYSFRLVLNSIKEIKLKWYQTGFFKFLIMAVGIIISVWTMGTDGGFFAQLAAATTKGFMAIMELIIPKILFAIASHFAFKFVAKALGIDLSMLLGFILTALPMAGVISPGSNFNLFGLKLPTAQTFLSMGNALTSASQGLVEDEIKGINEASIALDTEIETKTELLEEAQDFLGVDKSFNPLNFLDFSLNTFDTFNESPSGFYDRTIHAGNIGVYSLDVIENYHDTMLKLPKFSLIN